MAPGLGLGLSMLNRDVGGSFSPVLVDDLFFELDGSNNLQPRDVLPTIDNSDIWDFDGSNIMPALAPSVENTTSQNEEGFFEIDSNNNITPKL